MEQFLKPADRSDRHDILVVDDVPANLDLLVGLLAGAGYKVRAAASGALALQSAQMRPPALVLLDVRMPEMDGFEVCRQLKQDARTLDVPVIFVSGQNDAEDRVRGFEAGGVDFVGKPFHRHEVLARVRTHLTLQQTQVELERRVRERTEELVDSLERNRCDAEQQATLRQLLEYTLMGAPLDETLGHCLDALLAVSWLRALPQGAIFLGNAGDGQLHHAVSRNPSPATRLGCDRVAFGACLCGRAAATGELQFAGHIDERHELGHCGMVDHGHYCLPLATNGQVMGVLTLRLPAGWARDPEREAYLTSVAGVLAGYISRKEGEQALREHQAQLEATIVARTADLAASERRTRAIVATMLESVIHIDAHGTMLFVNFATENLFGYDEDEMLGRNVAMLMPEPHASAHDGYIARFLQTRERHVVGNRSEVTGRRKDGSLFPLELAVNEMVDDSGSTFLGVLRDMTAQKAAERALTEALDKANAATEAKSSFLANMSHEIRTPLNAVLGLAQIGVRDNRGRQTAALFGRIHESGNHLLAVVNDILDFSKIEAGKFKIEARPFALTPLIGNVKSFVEMRAEEKGLALSISLAPDLAGWVDGDALRVTQILTNLLANAIKFTDSGAVTLRAARDGDKLEFLVADTGCGMDGEQLSRLFQAFEQADVSTTRTHGGTGLGLAISRKLARLMGGDIEVDSAQGQGSSFYLHLPLPAVAPPDGIARPAVGADEVGRRLDGLSILAADDVEINRFILEDLVTHEGARIVLTCDGQETLNVLREAGADAFDVVLMDVQMPVMDGLEATRRIGRMAPGLPVIGLTAHALVEEREKCLAAGMVDHVVKPVDIDVLVDALRRHVRRRKMPGSGQAVRMATDVAAVPAIVACNDPEIVDLNVLVARVGNDSIKIAKYAHIFLDSARDSMARLKSAQAANDFPALGAQAHRLKSAALTVGAMRFGELCRELEGFGKGGDVNAARALVGELALVFERIERQLKRVADA